MGKGDKKSKRGKIFRGSFGKRRPKKKIIVKTLSEVKGKKKDSEEKTQPSKAAAEKTEEKVKE
jgi:30S ribosomal protein S31